MSHNGIADMRQMMVVISTVEQWSSLKSLQQDNSGDKHLKLTFSSLGSNQVCDLTLDGRLISLLYADLKQDMTEEGISQALDGCFKSCTGGISTFLLLIQGAHYTTRERRMVETLQAHFGAEALKYLVVISLEDGQVADTLDDALLEMLNMCDGRYCRITSSAARDELRALLKMVDYMLAENGVTGYTEAMLTDAKRRSKEDSVLKMLKQKVQKVEEEEQAFKQLVQKQEKRRAKEMEELKARHAEERRKEAADKQQYETKRGSLEEDVISQRAIRQLKISATDDDGTKKMTVILLGLSGSGKSSALNLILERAGNQYSSNESSHKAPQPTLFCERKEVFAAGRRLILVDTPELWDEDGLENLEVVKDCLALSLPGPHVFLLVLQVGRFTQGECEMLGQLQKVFGRDFAEHAVVLLVRFDCDNHRPQKINDYVAGAHATLQDLIRKCGSRYYELNVTKSQNALSYPQVKDLLSGINKVVASHGGRPYSVKRFSVQELQERKTVIGKRKEGALEGNYLLRDA
ncbi:GTPase IMAP family member 8-like [Sebastes umbrosus]|uniref:GTPase IMAP family member 8-like n=1 Tax=Sebastes umbrosus TaxID=72105 RepID=UPI00189F0FB2|nr:GTPase IMAP family member 8-like [Sebastes umbrosus]